MCFPGERRIEMNRVSQSVFGLAFLLPLCVATRVEGQVIFQSEVQIESLGDSNDLSEGILSSIGLGGRNRLPNDTAAMLRMPQIKSELGLQDDQIEAIGRLSKAMQEQMSGVFKNIDFAGIDSQKIMAEAQRAIRQQTEEKLEELLTPPQLRRLKELKAQSSLKSQGALAVTKGELGDAIRLSDKQTTRLKKLHARKQAELESEISALREAYREETLKEVLTPVQKKELQKLAGEGYEIKKRDFRSMFQGMTESRESATAK